MFRSIRHCGTGIAFVMILSSVLVVGCNNQSGANGTNGNSGQIAITPGPSPTGFNPPLVTSVPVTGPTLAETNAVALSIINAMPSQIGRFTLSHDPTLTYVGTVKNADGTSTIAGDRITYTTSSGAQLVFAIWIGQNANYPVDRWNIEMPRQPPDVAQIPVEVGDQALALPTNKGRDDNLAYNPAMWGVLRFRNIMIEVDPTKTLTDQTSTTKDEVVQLLTAALNAIPK